LISTNACCYSKEGEVYAIYLPDAREYKLNLSTIQDNFSVEWFDPLSGGDLQRGSIETIEGGAVR
jgi:hypothetical protein